MSTNIIITLNSQAARLRYNRVKLHRALLSRRLANHPMDKHNRPIRLSPDTKSIRNQTSIAIRATRIALRARLIT